MIKANQRKNKRKQRSGQEEENKAQVYRWSGWSEVRAWVTLISAVSLAVLTYFLVKKTSEQANAASQSIEIYRENSHKQLRAYLVIEAPKLDTVANDIHVRYIIKNHGQTPAYDVEEFVAFQVRLTNATLVVPDTTTSFNRWVVGDMVKRVKRLDDQVIMSRRAPWQYYFWGRITYKDVFGDSHSTAFCYVYYFKYADFFPYKECNNAD